jgi:hypothetical protein
METITAHVTIEKTVQVVLPSGLGSPDWLHAVKDRVYEDPNVERMIQVTFISKDGAKEHDLEGYESETLGCPLMPAAVHVPVNGLASARDSKELIRLPNVPMAVTGADNAAHIRHSEPSDEFSMHGEGK